MLIEKTEASHLTIRLSPERTAVVLAVLALVLIVLCLIGQFSRHVLGHGQLLGFVDEFHLDLESNVPTWVASTMLAFAALILAVLAKMKAQQADPWRLHWKVLCALFVFISLDEMASLHERLVGLLRPAVSHFGSIFHFAWVVAGIGFALVAGVYFMGFLWNLRKKTGRLFVVSGSLYLGGALGMEMVGGAYVADLDEVDLVYVAITTFEETLELAGTILFIYALLDYARSQGLVAQIATENEPLEGVLPRGRGGA